MILNIIAQTFNNYFVNVTESLPIFKWNSHLPSTSIFDTLRKFENHDNIINIKGFGFSDYFEFSHVFPWETLEVIESLDPNKATSGNIPIHILKLIGSGICISLTDCINNCINDGVFPDNLKLANVVIRIHKDEDSCLKVNYRPISLLPVLSKVVEKLFVKRIHAFMDTKLSKLLCGFGSGYSTQHALFHLIQKWQSCLDKSGKIGSILMDLSKAIDSLPHDPLIAKFAALLIIKKSEICDFADDNTLFICESSLRTVLTNLEIDLNRCLKWFRLNQLAVNPMKFQLIFLGVTEPNISLIIGN